MDTNANFWHQRWETNEIGFHQNQVNPLLVTYFEALTLTKGSRVFVPLCGKTLDIGWLLANDCRVAGAELSELAVKQLFTELALEPQIADMGELKHYSATDLDIFVGDIFNLTRKTLGAVDAVFDRAALVALPENVRIRYASHLIDITDNASQLLITYAYDQNLMQGPPFSVSNEEVNRHYKDRYTISSLASLEVVGGMRRTYPAKENVWLLKPLTTR
ncbi:MAG TPA: thiopurine S-methyltransferase [Phototrophicaceae bacterium]|jgi:thiopurine S-methyltransferase|nr:thiopurine S-methyltransferase [Phototrophicaceae bacterium]